MFKHILVPLDRSSLSEQALTVACGIAALGACKLTLIEVHPKQDAETHAVRLAMAGADIIFEEYAQTYLATWARRLGNAGIAAQVAHATGRAGESIAQYASLHGIDLVVMSTHGRTGIVRASLGSVADEVARMAACPVLLVHPEHTTDLATPDVTGNSYTLKSIMVPLDGSALAEGALDYVVPIAKQLGARIHLVRVATNPYAVYYSMSEFNFANLLVEERRVAHQYLADVAIRLQRRHVHVHFDVLEGDVHEEICSAAIKYGIDMIGMATHGQSGLRRWLRGSNTTRVVHNTHTPVLLVRAKHAPVIESQAKPDDWSNPAFEWAGGEVG